MQRGLGQLLKDPSGVLATLVLTARQPEIISRGFPNHAAAEKELWTVPLTARLVGRHRQKEAKLLRGEEQPGGGGLVAGESQAEPIPLGHTTLLLGIGNAYTEPGLLAWVPNQKAGLSNGYFLSRHSEPRPDSPAKDSTWL